jgi:hypothetical protein
MGFGDWGAAAVTGELENWGKNTASTVSAYFSSHVSRYPEMQVTLLEKKGEILYMLFVNKSQIEYISYPSDHAQTSYSSFFTSCIAQTKI